LLAWRANRVYFLPRHFSAAAERLPREGKENSRIPLPLLLEESEKEYEKGILKRLEAR
jgi:hypothetical protein